MAQVPAAGACGAPRCSMRVDAVVWHLGITHHTRDRLHFCTHDVSNGSDSSPAFCAAVDMLGEFAGLAGALQLLKQRGELSQSQAVVWSGRNNDMSRGSLKVVEDVFTGGRAEDRIANSIENALRRTDEFGRQMTPKEAYRELNYKCAAPHPIPYTASSSTIAPPHACTAKHCMQCARRVRPALVLLHAPWSCSRPAVCV